jgi:hypothetical protein
MQMVFSLRRADAVLTSALAQPQITIITYSAIASALVSHGLTSGRGRRQPPSTALAGAGAASGGFGGCAEWANTINLGRVKSDAACRDSAQFPIYRLRDQVVANDSFRMGDRDAALLV